jgi:hypothetical protein
MEIFVMYGNAASLKATLDPYLAILHLTELCCTILSFAALLKIRLHPNFATLGSY